MTDSLELELRAAMVERSASRPIAEVVERLKQLDYPSSSKRPPFLARLGPWPVLAAAAALTAGIVTVVLTASPATPVAYAGWTPSPRTPSPVQLAAATRSCNRALFQSSPAGGMRAFPKGARAGRLVTLASGFSQDTEALPLRTPARVLGGTLKAGDICDYHLGAERRAYLVPATGTVEIGGRVVHARDGAAVHGVEMLSIKALEDAEIMLVDATDLDG